MLKTLDEKLDESFLKRAESLTENVKEPITPEAVRDEFLALETIHKKYFPKSQTWMQLSSLGRPAIFFISTVHDVDQWYNKISRNDPMHSTLSIYYKGDGKYVAEMTGGTQLMVLPEPGSPYAREGIKVPFRKYTGTPEQIVKKYEEWEKKRKETYEEYKDRLPT